MNDYRLEHAGPQVAEATEKPYFQGCAVYGPVPRIDEYVEVEGVLYTVIAVFHVLQLSTIRTARIIVRVK